MRAGTTRKQRGAVVLLVGGQSAIMALVLLGSWLAWGAEKVTVKKKIELQCEKGTFTTVELENTRKRSYTPDVYSPGGRKQSCDLADSTEGVIYTVLVEDIFRHERWVVHSGKLSLPDERGREAVIWRVVLEGHVVDWHRLSLRDERGREFSRACWSRTKTGILAPQGGLVEFFAAGPEDSKKVTLCCADKCVDIEVSE